MSNDSNEIRPTNWAEMVGPTDRRILARIDEYNNFCNATESPDEFARMMQSAREAQS